MMKGAWERGSLSKEVMEHYLYGGGMTHVDGGVVMWYDKTYLRERASIYTYYSTTRVS